MDSGFDIRPSPRGIQEGRVRTSCHLIAEGSGKTCVLQISRSSPRPCGCERDFEPISLSTLPIYQIFSSGITVQTRSVNMSVFRSCLSFLPVFRFLLPNIGIVWIIRKRFAGILRTASAFFLFRDKYRDKFVSCKAECRFIMIHSRIFLFVRGYSGPEDIHQG